MKVVFDFRYLMHGKESIKMRLTSLDIRYKDNFAIFSVNFEDTKMVDLILKISRPGVFYIRCLSWNSAIIVFKQKMERRQYKSRHLIPMFLGTTCIIM